MAKVSVLIPAYNHEKYIHSAIESVLEQSFQDFEILISDDNSTDQTQTIIDKFTDFRIKKYFFDDNIGTVRSLNHLLSNATGEYIAVMGSDDIWEKDKLNKQIAVLDNNPQIGACFSNVAVIDDANNIITDETIFPINIFSLKNQDRLALLKHFFLTGNHLCHSSVMIRNSVHQELGNYNIAYRQLHDFDLWIRLLLKYNIYIIEEPLVRYRFVGNLQSLSAQSYNNNIRLFNEAENIFYYMFSNISDDDFCKAFCDSKNMYHEKVVCEKILLLKNTEYWGVSNSSLFMRFLFDNLNSDVLNCFEQEYSISLNDIYITTSVISDIGYAGVKSRTVLIEQAVKNEKELVELKKRSEELEKSNGELNMKINEIYNSDSWKLMKPLRIISDVIYGRYKR